MARRTQHGSPGPPAEPARGETRVAKWLAELRRRAESSPAVQADPDDFSYSLRAAELLRELRVRQIELEMQNEELRTAQREVEEARDRFFDLQQSDPVAYLTLDPMGVILEVNRTATDLLRMPLEQLVHSKLSFLVRREDARTFERHLADVFAGHSRQLAEVRFRCGDGGELVARLASAPVAALEGHHSRCRTAILDITDLRRQEAAMRRLATAVADSDDAIFTLDFDGRIRSWNRGAQELYDWSEQDAVGESFLRLVPETRRVEFERILTRLAGGERIQSLDGERVALSGRALFVSMTASPLRSEGTVEAASFTERDVTTRRLAENERELRLRAVVDAALDGIVVVDQEGRIEELNPAAEKMFGCAAAELRGSPLALLVSGLGEERRPDEPARAREPGFAGLTGRGRELQGRRKSGAEFPAHIAVCEMELPDRVLYCAFVRDNTSEKELREELRQSQKMEVLGALAGGIAHDFNNVLQVIAGNAALALERMRHEEAPAHWVEKCRDVALQSGQLTHRLLTFQRKGSRARRPIPIDRVIEKYADLAVHLLGDEIRLTTWTGAPLKAVMAEGGQLEQILLNLVVNSRDAMPKGGGTIRIESEAVDLDEQAVRRLGLEPAASYVRLTVADNGHGMDEETRKRLFEPFFTTKASGQGTGLGLSIVHTIVEQLGGRVAVTSRPGEGTSFVFHFPAVAAPLSPEEDTAVVRPGRRVSVLLADDEPRVREVVEALLTRMGHQVTSANSGAELLALIEKPMPAPHLLLTDVMMPEMSGPVLAEQVRRRFPDIRVLFMSGVSADWLAAEGRFDPGAPLIVKPFDRKSLAWRIEEIMRSEAAQETILLVDDSADTREWLEDTLSESGYRVLSAGSLAEALDLGRGHGAIDFLLTDIQLPDGTGWDLARELASTHPTMRSLFMSGSSTAGLDPDRPFFMKPIDVDDLLAELEHPR